MPRPIRRAEREPGRAHYLGGTVVGVTALVGCQWGDEGKGKIVDILSERVDAVARYQGGANAGHTVVIGDDTYVFHLLPVGILRPDVTCLLGNGMVIDLEALRAELTQVEEAEVPVKDRLFVSPRAHVIFSYHKAIEKHRETTWAHPIGTTLRGIGPAYEAKAARMGLRIGDLYRPERLREAVEALREWALGNGCAESDLDPVTKVVGELEGYAGELRPLVHDVRFMSRDVVARGGELLLEGAQGTFLDLDHGTYPFVTSSNTSSGGAPVGVGVPPGQITGVVGVCKAYTTRVGEGPFPTEFPESVAEDFRKHAGEFGATTGRPRRCGWLDGMLLRYAVDLNGVTALVITKLDVLDGMETLRIATDYERDDAWLAEIDPTGDLSACRPVYEDIPGWPDGTAGANSWSALPAAAQRYLERIEEIAGAPIAMVSTGNRRDQVIIRREALLPGRVLTP